MPTFFQVACDSYPIIHPAVLGVCKWLHKEDNFKHLWIHLTESMCECRDIRNFAYHTLEFTVAMCKSVMYFFLPVAGRFILPAH